LQAIANGFPMAAICGKAEIMDHFKTRAGGARFLRARSTAMGRVRGGARDGRNVWARAGASTHLSLGRPAAAGLTEIHRRRGIRATVAGFGSVFLTCFMDGSIESYSDLLRNDQACFLEYRRKLFERGIFKLPVNLKRNHISYAHTEADIDRTVEACDDVLKEMFG
jgi:glutamate-1-semialdehyde 2,1-aminomutase